MHLTKHGIACKAARQEAAQHTEWLESCQRVAVPSPCNLLRRVGVASEIKVVADAVGDRRTSRKHRILEATDKHHRYQAWERLKHVLVAALHPVELVSFLMHVWDSVCQPNVEVRSGTLQMLGCVPAITAALKCRVRMETLCWGERELGRTEVWILNVVEFACPHYFATHYGARYKGHHGRRQEHVGIEVGHFDNEHHDFPSKQSSTCWVRKTYNYVVRYIASTKNYIRAENILETILYTYRQISWCGASSARGAKREYYEYFSVPRERDSLPTSLPFSPHATFAHQFRVTSSNTFKSWCDSDSPFTSCEPLRSHLVSVRCADR